MESRGRASGGQLGETKSLKLRARVCRLLSAQGLGAWRYRPVFCPNCGSKNEDAAVRCGQCGFELQVKKAAPRFKGTMVMQSPVAGVPTPGSPAPGAPAPGAPSPGAPSPREATPGAAPRNASLKGTMVGVAPPGVDEVRKQIAAQGPAAGAAAPAPKPQAKLKGTMLGLAPPDMAAMAAAAAEARPEPMSAKPVPSQLKGTMLGVAPPDIAALQKQANLGTAPTHPAPPEEEGPPSAPADPLGGTMLGAGPFAFPGGSFPSAAAATPASVPAAAPSPGGKTALGVAQTIASDRPPPELEALERRSSASPSMRTSAPPPQKSSGPMVALIIALLVLAAALVGVGIMLKNRNSAPAGSAVPAAH